MESLPPRAWLRKTLVALSFSRGELRRALLAAWLILSLALGAAGLAALAMPAGQVLELAARCERPGGHQEPCALCGMTRAFLALRQGDLRGAKEANAASMALFPLLGLNEAAAAAVVFFRRKSSRGGMHSSARVG
jgi:hypothetical protein